VENSCKKKKRNAVTKKSGLNKKRHTKGNNKAVRSKKKGHDERGISRAFKEIDGGRS